MDEHYLQSPTNPVVKDLVRLQRRSGRQEQQQFLVEGLRAVDGFIAQGWVPVHYVLADEQAAPEHWPEALIYRLSKPAWSKVATTVNPSGIAAVFALPAIQENCADLAELPTLVLVGMSDPGNVGTLLRSAAAFAWKQVVVVGGADPFAPKVVNASVGAMAALRLWRCPADLAPESLAAKGALHALVARDGVHPRALRIGAAPFVVVGNEAHGLPEHWIRAARHRVTLPMAKGVESLNAAMAGTVACWALSSLA